MKYILIVRQYNRLSSLGSDTLFYHEYINDKHFYLFNGESITRPFSKDIIKSNVLEELIGWYKDDPDTLKFLNNFKKLIKEFGFDTKKHFYKDIKQLKRNKFIDIIIEK